MGERNPAAPRRPGAQEPAVAVQKCYDLVLWLLQRIESFPRTHRFTVGDRLAAAALDVLENLLAAAYTREKRALLEAANLRLHRLRMLVRLAKDLRLLSLGGYEYAAEHADEVGRLLGGWLRSRREPAS